MKLWPGIWLLALGSSIMAVELGSQLQKQKVIFDSDLGSDIDDAFALALLLSSPEFQILGITLGHGQTEKRGQLACRLLYETGMEHIPVAVGRSTMQVAGNSQGKASEPKQFLWAEGFSKVQPIDTPAADFILRKLRQYPKQIILFAMGPTSNMFDLLKKDPTALQLAKRVYAMFGSFYMGYNQSPVPSAEWNVRADIPAARSLVTSQAPITYAGLDITAFVTLEAKQRCVLWGHNSPLTDGLHSLYQLWDQDTPILYDPVPLGMVLWPDLFRTQLAHVRVTDEGYTVIEEDLPPNSHVGISIRKEEFLRRLVERFLKQRLSRCP